MNFAIWRRWRGIQSSHLRIFTGWVAVGVCSSILVLAQLGYNGVQGWRRRSAQLMTRRMNDAAGAFAVALTRDMRAVESSVLASDSWVAPMLEPPYDIRSVVANAYARYPYPETFFGWRGKPSPSTIVFFNRATRRPPWCPHVGQSEPYPVTIHREPSVAELLTRRIRQDVAGGEPYSVFEMQWAGVAHQVVVRLRYADAFSETIESGFGFAVDLAWARQFYFPELVQELWTLTSSTSASGLGVSLVDDLGQSVVQIRASPDIASAESSMPLYFFDPMMVPAVLPADVPRRRWAVRVMSAARTGETLEASTTADQMLVVMAATAVLLGLGLTLAARAALAHARLAELRSDFVSSVTHELKTPLATIRAAGEAVSSGRVADADRMRGYAAVVAQEARRLTRLVENVLAYARVSDVTEPYHFETIAIEPLAEDAVQRFERQLVEGDFQVVVDIPPSIAPIRADRTALGLLFDNLIDNAIRYSEDRKLIHIRGRDDRAGVVRIVVSDAGKGIPASQVKMVSRKFFRGSNSGPGGSGLGLAIVSRIVLDHGGQLDVESVEGCGTSVSITLPAASNRK
jgi:signal transduction histidine kinase